MFSNQALFIYHHDHAITYNLSYVDDIILAASSDTLREFIMAQLSFKLYLQDMSPINYFLDIYFARHSRELFLAQKKYVA